MVEVDHLYYRANAAFGQGELVTTFITCTGTWTCLKTGSYSLDRDLIRKGSRSLRCPSVAELQLPLRSFKVQTIWQSCFLKQLCYCWRSTDIQIITTRIIRDLKSPCCLRYETASWLLWNPSHGPCVYKMTRQKETGWLWYRIFSPLVKLKES